MTLTEAAALELVTQDRPWQWTRLRRDELRSTIETGVPAEAWDHEGVSWVSRTYLGGAR